MLLLKTACFLAAGLDVGIIILILATFGPSWTLTLATFGFGFLLVTIFITTGRLLYRAGYDRAEQDRFAAPRPLRGPTEMNVRSGTDRG